MEKMQFEDPNKDLQLFFGSKPIPRGLIGLLINHGWAKNVFTANMILVSVIVVCVAISFFFFKREEESTLRFTPEQIRRMEHIPKI